MLIPTLGMAQVIDNFSDGDFTANPTWEGTPGDFIINTDSVLQVENTSPSGSDISFLSTQFAQESLANKEWQFWIKQSFSGSANNYGQVWLVGNETNPTDITSTGYFIQFGEGGSNDAIELFYSNGGSTTSVCRGTDALIAGSFELRVRVRRDAVGLWSIDIDEAAGYDFVPHTSGTNTALTSTDHISVLCKYTSSNADNFFYDDFYFGDYILDVTAPQVSSVTVVSINEVDVLFSEPVEQTTAETLTNYNADGGLGLPSSASLDGANPSLVHLTFGAALTNGTTYNLTISNVEDPSGNVMISDIKQFAYVVTVAANFRDVVINEFMCDPTPFVGLADAEFVEVFNTSSNYIDLTDWKLGDASGFGTVGSHIIAPQEYALLIATGSADDFAFYPNVVLVSSFPSLNNTGDDIILQDTSETVIDQISYNLTWYQDENKESGGYSIEQINPFASCTNSSNWIGSSHPLGGTPSEENSGFNTAPDTIGPELIDVVILDAQTIELFLNEALNTGAISAANVLLDPVVNVTNASSSSDNSILVTLGTAVDSGVVYTVNLIGISDCEGNLQGSNLTETFILPFDADSGDFVINEMLFNPYTGGVDYVELVNNSDRPLNLKGWMLANYDEEDGISNQKTIITQNYAVEAGGYVLITEDTTDVMMNYIQHGVNNFIEADLPSYNNDSGTVYLMNLDSIITESFSYNEDLHFPLLSSVDGVSLERLDVNRPVNDLDNWHSAAQSVGFGTPGLQNSQFFPTSGIEGEVTTDPEIFSPYDGDGINDLLNINYNFTESGFVGTIRIFDASGRPVRQLTTNELLGPSGTVTWDGTTDNGEKVRIGMYVILFETFNTSGTSQTYKLSTVLGGRL